MTKDTKKFHFATYEKYPNMGMTWWIIINLFGWCVRITLK